MYKIQIQVGGGVLIVMLSLAHRIHSIYILRLFNDPIAMLFFFISVNFMVRKRFPVACVFYRLGYADGQKEGGVNNVFSLAVTVKMNILLFAPALFFILLLSVGPRKTILNLIICAAVQLLIGCEFLVHSPLAYLGRAFELGRVFQYRWSVNWQFVNETLFLSSNFHLLLLLVHFLLLLTFMFSTWFKRHGGLFKMITDLIRTGKLVDLDTDGNYSLQSLSSPFRHSIRPIYFKPSRNRCCQVDSFSVLCMVLPLTFLPSLLDAIDGQLKTVSYIASRASLGCFRPDFKNFTLVLSKWTTTAFILAGVELVYNVYPPRPWTSFLLFIEHSGIVGWLLFYQSRSREQRYIKLKQ